MNDKIIIIILLLCVVLLLAICIYLFFKYNTTQKTISLMCKKLKDVYDSDSDEYIMVFTDNNEIKKLLAQINELMDKLLKVRSDYKRLEISKKKMISNISHDIKTPMTVILGYLEIMRINKTSTDEMLTKVEKKAENVMELINQFFTLAKLESGDKVVEIMPVDICEVCKNSVLDFYEILIKDDYEVNIDVPDTTIYVNGNKDSIQRILFNLISNVIRYGSDGKYLGVTIREEKKIVYIDVIDKGKGIDKQFASIVFERLFTMDDSRNSKIQGNGLGLTIAKNLAMQLGGDILLESTPYEKTVFSVKLKKILHN